MTVHNGSRGNFRVNTVFFAAGQTNAFWPKVWAPQIQLLLCFTWTFFLVFSVIRRAFSPQKSQRVVCLLCLLPISTISHLPIVSWIQISVLESYAGLSSLSLSLSLFGSFLICLSFLFQSLSLTLSLFFFVSLSLSLLVLIVFSLWAWFFYPWANVINKF